FGDRLIVVHDDHATPLLGDFQRRNVALAVRAARELRPTLRRITSKSIERGVVQTRWRGRLERINIHGKSIWIDGLHKAHAETAAEPQPARAFELAMRSPQRSVFIGGSLYLAGAAIEYFDAQRKRSNKKQK